MTLVQEQLRILKYSIISILLLLPGGSIWLLFLFDAGFVGFGDAQEWTRDALIPAIWMLVGGAIACSGFLVGWRKTRSGAWLVVPTLVAVIVVWSAVDVLLHGG
jgi:hypothetical protein